MSHTVGKTRLWCAIAGAGAAVFAGAPGVSAAVAIAADTSIWSSKRVVRVLAAPGATFTLRYKRGGTVLGTQAVTMGPVNRLIVTPSVTLAKGDTVTVVGKAISGTKTFVSNTLDTPNNLAFADHMITNGVLTGAGMNFDLAGGFQVIADVFNPLTGDISGFVPEASVAVVGDDGLGNTIAINPLGDIAYASNLATALAASDTIGTQSSFNLAFAGNLVLNGVQSFSFTATAAGTSTYDLQDVPGAHETYDVNLVLEVAGLGTFTGNFQSEGIAIATPVPAPGSAFCLALGGFVLARRRRGR